MCSEHVLHCQQKSNLGQFYNQVNVCLGATLHPFFSSPIFRFSAPLIIARNFNFDLVFDKTDMGSLVHSRDGGEIAAVSIPSSLKFENG